MTLLLASACGQAQEPTLLPATTLSTTGGTILVEDGPLARRAVIDRMIDLSSARPS